MNDNATGSEAGGKGEGLSFTQLFNRTDTILAVVMLIVTGFLFFATTRFEKVPALMSQNIPPEWFPRLLLWIIALLTLTIPFEHLFLKKGSIDEDRRTKVKPISFYSALLLCCIVGLMPWLGTFLAMVFVCAFLPLLWGEKRLKVIIPFAIVFPGLVTVLFTKVLGVFFEPGVLARFF